LLNFHFQYHLFDPKRFGKNCIVQKFSYAVEFLSYKYKAELSQAH